MFSLKYFAASIAVPAKCRSPGGWLGALVLAGLLAGCEQPAPPPEVVRVVRTMQISDQAGRNQMELAADVRARTEVQLAFRVGGKLIERLAEVGQVVEPGQVLARLDPNDLRSAVAAANAQVQAAAVQRRQAQADLGRFEQLRSQGFISDAEMERHQAAFDGADAQYRQALAQHQVQANQAGYAQLTAETEGIVVAVEAEVGAVLAAGRAVVRIARNGERDVVFVVPEDQRDWVLALRDQRTPLPVTLWGSDRALTAQIREVAAAADAASRTFQVRAALSESHLAPGQTATVVMPLPGRRGALVPTDAVFERGGKAHVWLVEGSPPAVRAVPVQVEPAGSDQLLLRDGLPEGARIVTAGTHVLQDGQQVRLTNTRS